MILTPERPRDLSIRGLGPNLDLKRDRDRINNTVADILACLLDLNFKQSKLTRLNFQQAYLA